MPSILTRDLYKVMPWKNGRGTTAQIALDSEQSVFPDHFLWRVSSARVSSNDPFSNFDGCRRALVVVEGQGLFLNEVELKPFVPYFFSGNEPIDCRLVEGPVVDLGVIFNTQKVKVDMEVRRGNEIKISCSEGLMFFYLAEGEAKLSEGVLKKGDTLKLNNLEDVSLVGTSLVGVLISIKESLGLSPRR